MYFADALTLDAPKRTSDGYLAVRARASRTGVYQYTGREVDPENKHGLRDQAIVNVLRDDATVFDTVAARSFVGKPITDNHPSEPVTAANWRDHARGTIMGAMRDGDYLAFDLLLTDAATIAKVDSGKRELSNGYGAELEFGDFKAADGTACQARQAKITGGNHVALVDAGRAGPECAIKDGFALCDAMTADELSRLKANLTTPEKMKMKITIGDAKDVDLSDGAAVALAVGALNTSLADAQAKAKAAEDKTVADAATIVAKDAEIADLKAKLADAEITPAKLADAAKAYADVQAKAKALGVTYAADADTAAIKKAVVDAKMGEKAKAYTADHINIAFDSLTAGVKVADQQTGVQPIGAPSNMNDTDKLVADARAKMLKDLTNPAAAAA